MAIGQGQGQGHRHFVKHIIVDNSGTTRRQIGAKIFLRQRHFR